jgi:hypothetical protein
MSPCLRVVARPDALVRSLTEVAVCRPPQFVVPPIQEVRADCVYPKLPGMRLPDAVQGVHTAMMDMERRCVYACYAGAIVHAMEGWDHHEVGAIDPSRIDQTWEAALRHGFKLC